MTTDLIIQTLTEDDAFLLKERIFKDLARIVKGAYSGTFGLKISFADWIDPDLSNIMAKFLYDELVPKLIGMEPSELGYYEHRENWNYCESVNFIELFPMAGNYSFDSSKVVTLSNYGVIYYKETSYCRVEAVDAIKKWINKNDDPIFKSGLSKIYRRGFIHGDIRIKWKHELKDILQDC